MDSPLGSSYRAQPAAQHAGRNGRPSSVFNSCATVTSVAAVANISGHRSDHTADEALSSSSMRVSCGAARGAEFPSLAWPPQSSINVPGQMRVGVPQAGKMRFGGGMWNTATMRFGGKIHQAAFFRLGGSIQYMLHVIHGPPISMDTIWQPWISMLSMGMIHFHRTITVVAWANTAQSLVPSHGYIVASMDFY